jgi:phosphoribosyl 1,2-cyclic phosphodiesterase
MSAQKPLELILARNLLSSISTPAFLVSEDGQMKYGGNTSCVEVTLSDGSTLILDAGTGIRNLGIALPRTERPIHILRTHLHLDLRGQ